MRSHSGTLVSWCLSVFMVSLVAGAPRAGAEFAGGIGQPNDPYQIATAEQLISIGSDPNLFTRHFVLVVDIDLDPNLPGGRIFTEAVIAAPTGDPNNPERLFFTGTFDGDDHTIRNLTIHGNGGEWQGLFGEIGEGGRVHNLVLDGVHIRDGDRAGALAGWNTGAIDHCSATGSISGDWMVGGLVGQNGGSISHCHSSVSIQGGDNSFDLGGLVGMLFWNGSITDCHTTGKVSAGQKGHGIGGFLGNYYALDGTIANCWTTSQVSSGRESSGVGGLVGQVMMGGTIKQCYASGDVLCGDRSRNAGGLLGAFSGYIVADCYATGSVAGGVGTWPLGGLVGSASALGGTITNCYAVGRLSSGNVKHGIGGLIGEISYPETIAVTNCFWDVETSGVSLSAAGQGLTTVQMQSLQTYQTAGWDLAGDRTDGTADIWLLPPGGGYPQLAIFAFGYEPHHLAGTGTPHDPYLIATAEDLSAISQQTPAACYRLATDIDLSGITWRKACIPEFTGTFDGGGHRIRHLTIHSTEPGDVGFFGNMNGRVWNLALEGVSINAADKSWGIGGLAGSSHGYITSCHVTGSISVNGEGSSIGGLVGDARFSVVSDCYSTVSVSSGNRSWLVGGLVGYSYESSITRCYAAGVISAGQSEDVGGLVGGAGGSITRCFWDAETSGLLDGYGGTGLTTSQMTNARTFLGAGWDFVGETTNGPVDTWQMPEDGGYPALTVFSKDYQPHKLAGAGTSDDPYRITSAKDLGMISRYSPLASYRLTTDLDLSDTVWTAAPIPDFSGVFDGDGHTISNLTIRSAYFSALFGNLGSQAKVKNLMICDANIVGDDEAWYVGILAGRSDGHITGCRVMGRLSAGKDARAIGSIIGEIDGGVIAQCDAACDITVGRETYQVGGIAGFSLSGEIVRCRAMANVSGEGENSCMGGLLGEAHFWTVVSDCYATGSVSSNSKGKGFGGLVGIVSEGDAFPTLGMIVNCYAASRIIAGEGSSDVGGLLGKEAVIQPLTSRCYFLVGPDSLDNGNGTPLSDEQMKQQASFLGWDFDSVWTISEGKDYPRLQWEGTGHRN